MDEGYGMKTRDGRQSKNKIIGSILYGTWLEARVSHVAKISCASHIYLNTFLYSLYYKTQPRPLAGHWRENEKIKENTKKKKK